MIEKLNKIDNLPLVSVCIVTYNHNDYISQCLDSVLMQQTNFSFEIILGEDESSDGTRELCIAYANKNRDNIKLFLRSRKDVIYINGKPTGRYNLIQNLKAAKGKYVAILEGDDYWTDPLKLQKQVDFLEANADYAICFHRVYELEDGKECELSNLSTSEIEQTYTIEDLAKGNFLHTPSIVFRNRLIKKYPEWFNQSPVGDYVLHILNAEHGKIKYLPEPMAVYRMNSGSWSSQPYYYRATNMLFVLNQLIEYFDDSEIVGILVNQQINILRNLQTSEEKINSDKKYLIHIKLLEIINEKDVELQKLREVILASEKKSNGNSRMLDLLKRARTKIAAYKILQ